MDGIEEVANLQIALLETFTTIYNTWRLPRLSFLVMFQLLQTLSCRFQHKTSLEFDTSKKMGATPPKSVII